ncbi:MAG TPA: hypothetical protein GX736_06410 [Mogibacterium sp.]|nr:hypothetical protein [Mogibacterium sp.]
MSIEAITKRISNEAKAYAAEQLKQAEVEVEEILQKARIKAEQVLKDAENLTEKDTKTLVERRKSVADLEGRKMQLNAKQEVIKESFEEAIERFKNLEEEKYMKFLTSRLSQFVDGGGEVQLSAGDLDKYGKKLEEEFAGKFTVSKEPVNIEGGFLLKQDKISINASIEKLLEDQKSKLVGEVAKRLFAE